MKIKYITLFIAVILMSACKKDLNIKNLTDHFTPSLVINAYIEAGKAPSLTISKSISKFATDPEDYLKASVDKATVRIYLDNQLKEENEVVRTMEDNPVWLTYFSKVIPQAGQKIRLEVSSPGLKTAIFEGQMPLAPSFEAFTFEKVKMDKNIFREVNSGKEAPYDNYRVTIKFKDETFPTPRWFGVQIRGEVKEPGTLQPFEYSNVYTDLDPLFSSRCNKLMEDFNRSHMRAINIINVFPYFSNRQMNEQKGSLSVIVPQYENCSKYHVTLYALSNDYYKYAEWDRFGYELGDNEDSDADVMDDESGLREMFPTFSNIQGGIGLILLRTGVSKTYNVQP